MVDLSQIDSLLTVKQVAARLSVSEATVYGLCERRELRHIRVANAIRVAPDDLKAFLHAATDAGKERETFSSGNADTTEPSSPTSAASAIPSKGENR